MAVGSFLLLVGDDVVSPRLDVGSGSVFLDDDDDALPATKVWKEKLRCTFLLINMKKEEQKSVSVLLLILFDYQNFTRFVVVLCTYRRR